VFLYHMGQTGGSGSPFVRNCNFYGIGINEKGEGGGLNRFLLVFWLWVGSRQERLLRWLGAIGSDAALLDAAAPCAFFSKGPFWRKKGGFDFFRVMEELRRLVERSEGEVAPSSVSPGTILLLVANAWWEKARRALKEAPAGTRVSDVAEKVGPLDNSALFKKYRTRASSPPNAGLSERLVHGFDFVLVDEETWTFIVKVFDVSGPAVARPVVFNAATGRSEIELYPLELHVSLANPESGKWQENAVLQMPVSKSSSLLELDAQITGQISEKTGFDFSASKRRLYAGLYGGDFERLDVRKQGSKALGEFDWSNTKPVEILVEVQRGDGSWPRDDMKRRRSSSSSSQKRRRQPGHQEDSSATKKRNGAPARYEKSSNLDFSSSSRSIRVSGASLVPPPASAFAQIPNSREQGNPAFKAAAAAAAEARREGRMTRSGRSLPSVNTGNGQPGETFGVAGLTNLGNTCFMNSILQCLMQAQVFVKRFIDDTKLRDSLPDGSPLKDEGSKPKSLAFAFSNLAKMMWSQQHSIITPGGFLNVVRVHNRIFANGRQHDSQEFLLWLLDCMHEEVNHGVHSSATATPESQPMQLEDEIGAPSPSSSEPSETEDEGIVLNRAQEAWELKRKVDDSFVMDIFQGQYESRLQCEVCRHVSSKFDAFSMLSLPIQSSSMHESSKTIEECFLAYTSTEHLETGEQWRCPRCRDLRPATKTISLFAKYLPPILILHLKRFKGSGHKINSVIKYPDVLHMEDFCRKMEDGEDMKSLEYSLFAVTRHSGSLRSGHYTAFVSCADGGLWRLMNDSTVSHIGESAPVDPQAYILFYRRSMKA